MKAVRIAGVGNGQWVVIVRTPGSVRASALLSRVAAVKLASAMLAGRVRCA